MDIEKILAEKGIVLPAAPKPVGSYTPVVISRGVAYLSGQVSKLPDGTILSGKVGKDLTLEEAKKAARQAAINALSALKDFVGFDKIDGILRIVGFVQTAPDFFEVPAVINGASDLFLDVFGEKGLHARSSVGVHTLPMNAAVEIELTVGLKNA